MRNLAALAIQAVTPHFAELLLNYLHAKIRRLQCHTYSNMNEWTLKKVQQCYRHFKRKLPQFPVPLFLLDLKTKIFPFAMDGQEICTRMSSRDQWFWENIINSTCDKKFWKGNENLRSVYKKTVFLNFEWFLPFFTFFSSQKRSLSL
jgi:hypothetical protein